MNLFEINQEKTLTVIEPQLFNAGSIALKERQDLQAMLRDSPEAQKHILGEDLLVFAEEYSNWQDSQRRIDLLAVDRKSNLVVIELKRDEDGAHMELQAVRYAAMVSELDFPEVLKAYQDFLVKKNQPAENARETLLNFLQAPSEESVAISSKPRVILLARGFGKEMTTAILWLRTFGLDIRCVEMVPHILGDRKLLATQTIIPLPNAEDYIVKIGAKAGRLPLIPGNRSKWVGPELARMGALKPGDKVVLIRTPISNEYPNVSVSSEQRTAIFEGGNRFTWANSEDMTLTGICRAIYKAHSHEDKPFPGPNYFARENETESLYNLFQRLSGLEQTESVEQILDPESE